MTAYQVFPPSLFPERAKMRFLMPAGFETLLMSNSDLEHFGEISAPVLVPTPFPLNWQTIRAKLRIAGARAKKILCHSKRTLKPNELKLVGHGSQAIAWKDTIRSILDVNNRISLYPKYNFNAIFAQWLKYIFLRKATIYAIIFPKL